MVTLSIDARSFFKINKGVKRLISERPCVCLAASDIRRFVSLGLNMKDRPRTVAIKTWRQIRARIITRDHSTCQRCEHYSRTRRGLSVHHIIPRNEGGSDHSGNLITLCDKCHDTVEMSDARTFVEVIATDDPIKYYDEKEEGFFPKLIDLTRPIWHTWVYGGKRRPTQL